MKSSSSAPSDSGGHAGFGSNSEPDQEPLANAEDEA
jgi:hypothetical protein